MGEECVKGGIDWSESCEIRKKLEFGVSDDFPSIDRKALTLSRFQKDVGLFLASEK